MTTMSLRANAFASMARALAAAPSTACSSTMLIAGRGRPAGEVGLALQAAAQCGPGTVRELAERACVGYDAARYTASRLVSRGDLVPLGPGRPAVLAAPRSFWEGDEEA